MAVTLPQRPHVSSGDSELGAVDFTDVLDLAEELSSVAAVEVTTTDLTLSNKTVNTVPMEIDGRVVEINKAALFKFTGQTAGKTYRVRVTVTTTSSPSRTLVRDAVFITE